MSSIFKIDCGDILLRESVKVIEKSGFSYQGDIEIENEKHLHYTFHKEEWL